MLVDYDYDYDDLVILLAVMMRYFAPDLRCNENICHFDGIFGSHRFTYLFHVSVRLDFPIFFHA